MDHWMLAWLTGAGGKQIDSRLRESSARACEVWRPPFMVMANQPTVIDDLRPVYTSTLQFQWYWLTDWVTGAELMAWKHVHIQSTSSTMSPFNPRKRTKCQFCEHHTLVWSRLKQIVLRPMLCDSLHTLAWRWALACHTPFAQLWPWMALACVAWTDRDLY